MNTKKAIKICNWINDKIFDVSPMLMILLIFFGFGTPIFFDYLGYFSIIPFITLALFIFISFFIEDRLEKNFNLKYDFLNHTYKRKKI